METLILMTGTYRLDNLLKIAKSINKYYNEYISKFNIIWLITIDKTHAIGNIENTIEYLNSTNIHYNISYVNINKDKVYGGDLFNDTLKQYVLENNINPWVYVLDDDNLLHPSLFNTFNICLNNSFYGNKEIILLTLKWDDTYIREINEDILGVSDNKNFIQGEHMIDPSATILRYNILKKYGMFPPIYLYDFKWLNPFLWKEQKLNNIIFYHYYSGYDKGYVNAYHNGIRDIDNIKSYNEDINNLIIDVHVSNMDVTKHSAYVPILSNNIKEKIYKLILEELQNE
jgi:hypothetical protein